MLKAPPYGMTLIELLIVITLIGLLALLAMPSFSVWMADARVRTVAESLQNDLRRTQAEAIQRNRQVVLALTNDTPNSGTVTPSTSAKYWVARALPLTNSDEGDADTTGTTTLAFVKAQNDQSDTTVEGDTAAICFNSFGRMVASSTSIADIGDIACSVPTTDTPRYFRVQNTRSNRPLWVQVSLGGKIRMCDPNRTLPDQPDGCCTDQCCGFSSESYCVY